MLGNTLLISFTSQENPFLWETLFLGVHLEINLSEVVTVKNISFLPLQRSNFRRFTLQLRIMLLCALMAGWQGFCPTNNLAHISPTEMSSLHKMTSENILTPPVNQNPYTALLIQCRKSNDLGQVKSKPTFQQVPRAARVVGLSGRRSNGISVLWSPHR